MYDNIGGKIKSLAKTIFVLEVLAIVIIGFVAMAQSEGDGETAQIAFIIMLVAFIVAWISSWFLYGFGEIIEKLCQIEQNTRNSGNKSEAQSQEAIANKQQEVSL